MKGRKVNLPVISVFFFNAKIGGYLPALIAVKVVKIKSYNVFLDTGESVQTNGISFSGPLDEKISFYDERDENSAVVPPISFFKNPVPENPGIFACLYTDSIKSAGNFSRVDRTVITHNYPEDKIELFWNCGDCWVIDGFNKDNPMPKIFEKAS